MLVVISVWHTHVHWEFDWYILSKELKDSVTYQLIQPGIFGKKQCLIELRVQRRNGRQIQ
jgi:hypothetical protein